MEFITKLRQKHEASILLSYEQEASSRYTVTDFNGRLYFAFDGVPVIGIEPQQTAEDILKRLSQLRKGFSDYKKEKHRKDSVPVA